MNADKRSFNNKVAWAPGAVLALLFMLGCVACGKSSSSLGGMTTGCTAENSVTIEFGRDRNSDLSCGRRNTVFPVDTTFFGCTLWACVADGDRLAVQWQRPNGSIQSTDETTVQAPSDGRSDLRFSPAVRPEVVGQWRANVLRNGRLAGSFTFGVFGTRKPESANGD